MKKLFFLPLLLLLFVCWVVTDYPEYLFPEDFIIVIDPGHGYCTCQLEDPTGRCPDGEPIPTITFQGITYYNHDCRCRLEVEGVLEISQYLQRFLEGRTYSVKVFLTRVSNTEYPTDQERIDFVRLLVEQHGKVDLFISLHFNARGRKGMICDTENWNTTWSGTETFYCSHGSGLIFTHGSKAFFTALADSVAMAGGFTTKFEDAIERGTGWGKEFGVLEDNPARIKGLLEVAYITYPPDRKKLEDPDVRRNVAEAIYKTIVGTFAEPAPERKLLRTKELETNPLPKEIKQGGG